MVRDKEYLTKIASYCIENSKSLGATSSSVLVANSVAESVNFRNKKLEDSNRSDNLAVSLTT